jgi:uncharacterized membrane protein YphA (DoxX/SURF4 family)
MTTLFSTPGTVDRTNDISRAGNGRVVLWVGQLALAAAFLVAGGAKLAGAPAMVGMFNAIGVGQWFRYVTGAIEVTGAVSLLVPALAPYGAILLAVTMVCAVATHLLIVGGSALPALVLLAASVAIAWARRDRLERIAR